MDRRSVLAGFAALTAVPVLMTQTRQVMAAMPAPVSTVDFPDVKLADQFYVAVLGRAELSLASSQIAVDKATQKNAHEFAGFELGEAITVNMVLKDIGAVSPTMDPAHTAIIDNLKTAAKGSAFDQAYIKLQLENHEYLRDLADAYIHNSVAASDPAEKQGRHLSMLMFAVFKEHVAICKRISGELKA